MIRLLFPSLPLVLVLGALGSIAGAQEELPANAAEQEAKLVRGVRQLTFEGKRAGEGYFSHDGTRLVFQSEREPENPWYQIYLMDLMTGDTQRVSPGHGKTTCAWIHPDGRRVLYASTHLDPRSVELQQAELDMRARGEQRRYAWDYDDHFDLYAHDLETGEDRRLTLAKGYDAEGSYSPDGEWIAFSSNRHAFLEPISEEDQQRFEVDKSLFLEIYRMRADGSDVVRLTTSRGYDGGPFFSPNGEKICWRRFTEDGLTAEVYTMNLDGSEQTQLTDIGAMSWAPYFHPSGEYLIFTTNRHGFANFELYLVDVQGRSEPVRVTYTGGFDGLPVFTPDGAQLAWTTNRTADKAAQIHVGEWDHEAALRLLRASPERGASEPETTASAGTSTNWAEHGTTAPILADDLRKHVHVLASPEFEGRRTGTPGEQRATQYVADAMAAIGLEPAGDDGGWFQAFEQTVMTGHGRERGEEKTFRGRNVLGLLRTGSSEASRRVVLLGAHIDHLGMDGGDSSRAPAEEREQLHPGADDNASGVASLLEVAEWLQDMAEKGRLAGHHDILFAAWSGEEEGLLGSKSFVNDLSESLGRPEHLRERIVACLNMDMVGRMDQHLVLSGIGSSSLWKKEIERRNAPVGLPLSLSDDCFLPTDTSSFYVKGVPILSAFTGSHGDYHTPQDTPDKIVYEDMVKIARFMGLMTRALALREEGPDYILHENEKPRVSRTGAKAYLGTIPDYAKAEIPGLKLSGVATTGPAHAAGLRGGDIVVSLNGKEVEDIYGYTEALDGLKPGMRIECTVVREGERQTYYIVVGSRE